MSFSRWYPVSSYYYDPALQPSKPILNLQMKDETQQRKVPRGRYDTTYRREYLDFNNGTNQDSLADKYSVNSNEAVQGNDKSNLNPYPLLPPISPSAQLSNRLPTSNQQQAHHQQQFQQQQPQQNNTLSLDHIVGDSSMLNPQNKSANRGPTPLGNPNDNYLPRNPIYLNPQEESALMMDTSRELKNYTSEQLKNFYSDLTSYDPSLTGFAHYNYISLVAMRNQFPISESLLRFLMSRYVSLNQERGFVNYEELVKFLARCLSNSSAGQQQQQQQNKPVQQRNQDPFDPDEQAILRLMHENMREWDTVNLINCDNLRKKFYEIDPYNRYILTQREIEDVLYRERVPIQRSLIYQILEKYCKVATGQYKWPAFVDFLEKVHQLRLPNKKKNDYIFAADEKVNNLISS